MVVYRGGIWSVKTQLLVLIDVVGVLLLIVLAYLIGQSLFARIAILTALALLGWGTPIYLGISHLKKKKNGDFNKYT